MSIRRVCSEAFLFLLSARACGLGIDLPGITSVLILDSDWDPKADVQALGRAHTLGSLGTSARPLRMLRLFMRNSVEERILMLAERRGGVGAAFRPGSAGGCVSVLAQDSASVAAVSSQDMVLGRLALATSCHASFDPSHSQPSRPAMPDVPPSIHDLSNSGMQSRPMGHRKHGPLVQHEWQVLPAHRFMSHGRLPCYSAVS